MKDQGATIVITQDAEPSNKLVSLIRGNIASVLIAAILALFIRTFIVQTFKIPSGSMEDTLAIGDYILVNKFIYGTKVPFTNQRILRIREPRRGDVIVFQFPKDPSQDYIKRVIGLPGDRILIRDKKVYVNGLAYENPREVHKDGGNISGVSSPRDNLEVGVVPPGACFVMGDNRDNSYDSRFWGFVKDGNIRGLAFLKHWSWDKENRQVRWERIFRPIE